MKALRSGRGGRANPYHYQVQRYAARSCIMAQHCSVQVPCHTWSWVPLAVQPISAEAHCQKLQAHPTALLLMGHRDMVGETSLSARAQASQVWIYDRLQVTAPRPSHTTA